MDDDRVEPAAPVPPPKKSRKRGLFTILGIVLIVPLLLLALWTVITLNWSYSEGTRSGYLQKFSKKGWLCKTWEGELAMGNIPGSVPQLFNFTVRSDSLANEITKHVASRTPVSLAYKEHRGVPTSCFGETGYYVTGVTASGP
jgi:hypothetical protein